MPTLASILQSLAAAEIANIRPSTVGPQGQGARDHGRRDQNSGSGPTLRTLMSAMRRKNRIGGSNRFPDSNLRRGDERVQQFIRYEEGGQPPNQIQTAALE
jgi:hypothetical protein